MTTEVMELNFEGIERNPSFQTIVRRDNSEAVNAIGLFGTAGSPEDIERYGDWREPFIIEVNELRANGLTVDAFNPVVPDWTPELAALEANHLANDSVVVLPVLDTTAGYGTLAETGFGARRAARGQDIFQCIEPVADGSDQARVRSRIITSGLANRVIELYPELTGYQTRGLHDMRVLSINALVNATNRAASERIIESRSEYTLQIPELQPTIALIGSGADQYRNSWYETVAQKLSQLGVGVGEVFTAYKDDWDLDDAAEELIHKTQDATLIVAITSDQTSYAATAEIGWLVALAELSGQSLGIYVEKHNSDPKSDANRQRKLAMAHLAEAMKGSNLPVFVASSLDELALYAAASHLRAKQYA